MKRHAITSTTMQLKEDIICGAHMTMKKDGDRAIYKDT